MPVLTLYLAYTDLGKSRSQSCAQRCSSVTGLAKLYIRGPSQCDPATNAESILRSLALRFSRTRVRQRV
jgi:hypothetical protein